MQLKRTLIILALTLAGLAASGHARQTAGEDGPGVAQWRQQAAAALRSEDWPAFRDAMSRLHELRPYNDEYMYQLVLANALTEDRSAAYSVMLKMQQQGLAYDFDQSPHSAYLQGTQVYEHLNELMKLAGEPAGNAETVFTLPGELLLPSAMESDPTRDSLLVGTARDGAVYAVDMQGKSTELLRASEENGLWGIFGLLVDAEHNRLWISSGANALFEGLDPADAGRSALFEYTLDTLEQVRRYRLPDDGRSHRLGDIVRAPSGEIYVADGVLPIIYRLRNGEERLSPFVASPELVSLRGLELSPGGRLLYVADHEMGLMYVDLEAQTAGVVEAPQNLNLDGIEGLAHWNGHLLIVQSGIRPQRVMRLKLGETGKSITQVAPLAVAQPFFDYPAQAEVVGDMVYILANSHWGDNMVDPQPVRVARMDASDAPNLVTPDMQQFRKEFEAARSKDNPGEPAEED